MKTRTRIVIIGAGILLASLLAPLTVAAQDTDAMQWSVTPYIWGSNTTLDLAYRGSPIGGADISFKDLVDDLDSAFMIHAEGGKGRWSGFLDVTTLDTSARDVRQVITIDTDSSQDFVDAAIAFWPGGLEGGLNLFGGVRYTSFDDRYRFSVDGSEVATRRNSSDYTDALVGIRYRFDLGARWALLAHADTSFGDSEGTYLLRGLFAWTVGKRQQNRLLFGYQYKRAEFRDGDVKSKFVYDGPLAGFEFRF